MRPLFTAILTVCAMLVAACADRDSPLDPAASGAPRLAVLSPGFAATLADLDRADCIVARHAFDLISPASLPVAGDQSGLDYETLVSARPTHIILESNAQPLPDRLLGFAENYEWEIVRLPAGTLADIRTSITKLDAIANPSTHPSPVALDLTARFDASRGVLSTTATPREVLLMTWVDPIGVMGPRSYHHDLAKHIGLSPLPETGERYITLSVEDLIRLDPPTIILLMPNKPAEDPASHLPRQARERLTACKEGRVYLINDRAVLLGSTTLIKLADDLRSVLDAPAPIDQ